MSTDLGKALALQASLARMTGELASLISVPALERDRDAIEVAWLEISRQRAPLNALYRKLRKTARDMGRDSGARAMSDMVKTLNRCLRHWDEMDALVAHHMDPPEAILELDYVAQPQDPLLTHLYMALHTLANPNQQHDTSSANNYFADIPMEIQRFELLLNAAYRLLLVQGRADAARFLDVGCGGATKGIAAARVFSSTSLTINPI